MPPQTTTSALLAKLGDAGRKAHAKHKNDETVVSNFSELPAGIENGIAHLVDIKFDVIKEGKTDAGKLFFYAAGIAKRPLHIFDEKTGENIPVKGGRTSIMEMMADTPSKTRKTVEEHWAWMLNILRLLGVDTSKIPDDQSCYTKVAAIVDHLKKTSSDGSSPIFFRFRTYKIPKRKQGEKGYDPKYDGPGTPEPRTQHTWGERCEFSDVTDPAAGVSDDQTVEDNVPVEEQQPTEEAHEAQSEAASEHVEYTDSGDIDSLVERAEKQDAVAQNQLVDFAVAAGYEREVVEGEDVSWADIGEMVKNPQGSETVTDETVEWSPSVGEVYHYQQVDPKTKKPLLSAKTKKPVDPIPVTITLVNPEKLTVDAATADKKSIKGIAWSALIQK